MRVDFSWYVGLFLLCLLWLKYYFNYLTRWKALQQGNRLLSIVSKQDHFSLLLKNKNFLNHHNYFNSQGNQNIYKKNILKKNILWGIKMSLLISWFIILWWVGEILSAKTSLLDILWIFTWLFIFIAFILTIKVFWNYFMKIRNKAHKIYQEKHITNKKFITHKSKIFFY
jgi:hypothetical protein